MRPTTTRCHSSMIKKLALIGLLALSLAGCNDSFFSAKAVEQDDVDQTSRPAKIAEAKKVSFSLHKTFPGVTEASINSVLAFRVAGQISALPVLAGQVLKEGDLIAKLDKTPYVNVVTARQADYDLAKAQLTRTKELFAKNHVAKAALDTAEATFSSAEVALKTAREDVGYTKLLAPYDGVVAKTEVERYQNVAAGAPIVQYNGNKDIDIVFNVPESLFLNFSPSKMISKPKVAVRFDALPGKVFDAQYKEHEGLPDAVTRSYKVTVTMPQPDNFLVLPGMSSTVTVDVASFTNIGTTTGVLVPLESVFEEQGKRWVWKVDANSEARKTEVEVHGIEDGGIRLTSGLEEGDKIIAVGVGFVTEGEKVRPYKKERGL